MQFRFAFTEKKLFLPVRGSDSGSIRLPVCGVPQGSCLGPTLFLMYVNDLPLSSDFDVTIFADDTFLLLSHSNLDKLEKRVNYELRKIDYWLRKNKLLLNYVKTNYMIINKQPQTKANCDLNLRVHDYTISRVNTVKYLGVLLDDDDDLSISVICPCN